LWSGAQVLSPMGILYPDLNGFEGWMDKKIDFQWMRSRLFL
jgi:hypothetical protein